MRFTIIFVVALSWIDASSSILRAQESWPAFQNGGDLDIADTSLPQEWQPTQNIAWQIGLEGYGQSTPVIYGDLIYVTSVAGPNKEKILLQAFQTSDGKQVWKFEGQNSTPEKNTTYVSRAAPTPVVDALGVIAFFEGGNLVALDHKGEIRWEHDLIKTFGPIAARHGLSSSLEQQADQVYVWVQRSEEPYVLALSKKTGEVLWKSEGLMGEKPITSWASPRLVPVGSSSHLVLSGSGKIAGYSPKTGKKLWTFDQIAGNTTPTPIPLGSGRFLMGASGGRESSGGSKPAESNGVIEIVTEGSGAYSARWDWKADKATSSFGSPVAFDGRAYFVNRVGVLFCLDLKTGEEVFAGRLPCKSIWATPVATGKHIYFFGKDGSTSVIDRGDALNVAFKNKLWEPGQSKPPEGGPAASFGGPVLYAGATDGAQLFLRRGDILYCVKSDK